MGICNAEKELRVLENRIYTTSANILCILEFFSNDSKTFR